MIVAPLLGGGVKFTVALESSPVAVTAVGLSGTVFGTTGFEALDGALVPAALVTVTWNVYAVPRVRLVTICGVAALGLLALPSIPPGGLEITV